MLCGFPSYVWEIIFSDTSIIFGNQVEPNAHRIEEHRRKYDRLRKEREERRDQRERQRRRAEAQVATFIIFFALIKSMLFCFLWIRT